jgi:hypothetical protein
MCLVVINCYVLNVFLFLICVPLHIDYYIPLLDIILIIRYMLWGMCHMLAERHVVVSLWRSVWMFSKKKKKTSRHTCGLSHNMLNQQIIGDSNLIPSFIHVKHFQSFFFLPCPCPNELWCFRLICSRFKMYGLEK